MNLEPKSNGGQTAVAAHRRNPKTAGESLSLASGPYKTASQARSADPYNSSGSFDRTKNWASVGKR